MLYAGQMRTKPVMRGTTPIHPHIPTVPVAARAIKTRPTRILMARSMVPTFACMASSLIKRVAPALNKTGRIAGVVPRADV